MVNKYTLDDVFKVQAFTSPSVRTGVLKRDGHPLQVMIISSDPSASHKQIMTMNGRRVRVTIEILDSPTAT